MAVEAEPSPSIAHEASGRRDRLAQNTQGTPMRLPSRGAPWNLRRRWRSCASSGSCVVLREVVDVDLVRERLPPAAPTATSGVALAAPRPPAPPWP